MVAATPRGTSGTAKGSVKSKVVLLGGSAVGKTCILMRFTKGVFPERTKPTTSASFAAQYVNTDEALVKLELWDTAGQERYKSLAPTYYRGAAAAIIVYDITSPESLTVAKTWVLELQGTNTIICLVGNKVDLALERKIERSDVEEYVARESIFFTEVSAKDGRNVQELFRTVAERILKTDAARSQQSSQDIQTLLLKEDAKSSCAC